MDLQIFDCEQGTPEWFACRMGIPTASEFDSVMAKGRGGSESKTRRTYMFKLAGELITGEPACSFTNEHMERGKAMEDEARSLYCMLQDAETSLIGFMRRGDAGCSPDSLIGETGMLEIKTKLPHLQIDVLESGEVPSEHRAQCQGQLWISGREWVDFVSYWPALPPFIQRIYRDEKYIEHLAAAVDQFNEELQSLVERVRRRAA